MRIVFLDIDGVLNSERLADAIDHQHRAGGHAKLGVDCKCYARENHIDPECIWRLNTLVTQTGSEIVISSSWRRLLDLDEVNRILGKHGLVRPAIGATPDLVNELGWFGFHHDRKLAGSPCDRGWEIWDWLFGCPEVSEFVILDDCSDMALLKPAHVLVDDRYGLREHDIGSAAIKLGQSRGLVQLVRSEPWR